ncbi:YdcF family protein [Sphingomonas montana]|uniref:YdcF family protein n=1 Tax=Sphingomonas montana TaxID=1843236 RepID=UPI00096DD8FD|nr:YdcF family protein [Sphingomonas montana]
MMVRLGALVLLVWALGFVWFAVALPGPGPESGPNGQTDGIVVVTGGPGRIPRGTALLQAGHARRMLISGVDRRVRPRDLTAEYGVPRRLIACCIDLGDESVDTRSNADETAAWVGRHRYRSIRLVTTDWHMARARFELVRVLGRDVTVVPDGVRSEPGFLVLMTEYTKYLLRRISAPLGY